MKQAFRALVALTLTCLAIMVDNAAFHIADDMWDSSPVIAVITGVGLGLVPWVMFALAIIMDREHRLFEKEWNEKEE